MSRTRKLVVASGVTLAGLLLAAVSAVLILRTTWFGEKVRQRIVREIEETTGGRAELGSFSFDWHTLQAEIRHLTLHGTEPASEPPLCTAGSVRMGLRIVSALHRDVDIQFLHIEKLRLHIALYKDGRTNLPQPKVARLHRNPVEEVLALAIRELRVEDGLINFGERTIPLDLRGEQFETRLLFDAHGPRYTGEIAFRSLRLKAPAGPAEPFGAAIGLVLKGNELEVTHARLFTDASNLQFAGAMRDLLAPQLDFSFQADFALKDLNLHREAHLAPQGRARLAGTVRYRDASDYSLKSRLAASGLMLEQGGVRLPGIALSSDVALRPGVLDCTALRASLLGGSFAGKARVTNLRQVRLEGDLTDLPLKELSRLPGLRLVGWNGRISGPLHAEAEIANGDLRLVQASGLVAVSAEAGDLPVQGSLDLDYRRETGVLSFGSSYLATRSSEMRFDGVLGRSLRVSLHSRDLRDFSPVAAGFGAGGQRPLPLTLDGGTARFDGLVTGKLEDPLIAGHASLTNVVYQGHRLDRIAADVRISERRAQARNLVLAQGTTRVDGEVQVELAGWGPVPASRLEGSLTARQVSLDKIAAQAGWKTPLGGTLSGAFTLGGTVGAPEVTGKVSVQGPAVAGQRFDRARADFRYTPKSLDLLSARLEAGRAFVQLKGAFAPRAGSWDDGTVRFEASGKEIPLARLLPFSKDTAIQGTINLEAAGEGALDSSRPRLNALSGKMQVRGIEVEGKPVGTLELSAGTNAGELTLGAEGEIAGTKMSGTAACRLTANYPSQGEVRFEGLNLSSLRPWWGSSIAGAGLPLEARANGKVAFSGEGLDEKTWNARVELSTLEVAPEPGSPEGERFMLVSNGPVILRLERKGVFIERAQLAGKDTDLQVSGSLAFGSEGPLQLQLRGAVNLAVLHNLDEELTASGNSVLDGSIRGTLAHPQISGRLEFKDASFYLSDVPNGIDKASGVILFTHDRATIEKITAETGGGKLALGGFIGFGGDQIVYRLQADADQVRIRYPEGISTTLNATLRLTGTSTNSTLAGTVTVLRSGISPRVDLAALLARSSKPLVTPATQNKLLRGMLFDVRLQMAPDARFDTTLTKNVHAEADLRLRGTAYKPALLGRISVTQGEVNFLGTTYTINRGDISFLNPVKLEPVLNLDLATRVMGTEVSMTFAGPLDKLNINYRSDPPLQQSEIIALLAVGRQPSTDPTLTARQAAMDQASLGAGEVTSVIGQVLAAPVTGRLERFFGVSRLRIDPRLTGVENNPETQLTLEQQVSKDVTVTYITTVGRAQWQIFRVEMTVTRQWSVLAVRDENGLFGIDVLFRKQFK